MIPLASPRPIPSLGQTGPEVVDTFVHIPIRHPLIGTGWTSHTYVSVVRILPGSVFPKGNQVIHGYFS
jgi:hypothetical protein